MEQVMLILARKVGQSIMIGDDVEVTITSIVGNQVKLGIQAPKHISVDREEIRYRKNSEDANGSTVING